MGTRFAVRGGRAVAAALFLSLSLLAGCGDSKDTAAQPGPSPASIAPAPKATPASVKIAKIGAESSLIKTAVKSDGSLDVPPVDKPMQASWYAFSAVPGQPGAAVLLGHVDGNSQPGIFFKLKELSVGDEVTVKMSDGTDLKFAVSKTQQVNKDELPKDAIFGKTDASELRLITCGGVFDKAAHSYKDNTVVYAKLKT
ncbi:class F sortase [Pseudonocardiaceae bacterium YIM PH 21723]|nr:class F sortase [Pseudonocardiaceae bacterium YIM PH 21723]